jgi:hypothetical protein
VGDCLAGAHAAKYMRRKPEGPRPESLHDQLVEVGGERIQLRDIPELALHWLEMLTETGGLPGTEQPRRPETVSKITRVTIREPINAPSFEDAYLAILENGQKLWLREGKRRTAMGSRTIEVLEKPERTDAAVLAMLTVLEGRPIKAERVPEVFSKSGGIDHEEYDDLVGTALYAYSLLRYFRQDFSELPREERLALIEGACSRINDLLEASRKLVEYLEYGTPDRDLRSAVENASMDINAAVLRDVDELTYREIAEQLDLPISDGAKAVGDHSKVSRMVDRGRDILERACGKDGWREKAEAMKAEAARWYSLTPEERVVEECAELLGVSPQEAQRMLLDEEISEELDDRQSSILVASKISYYRAVQQRG